MFSPTDTSRVGTCAWKVWVKVGIFMLVKLFQAMGARVSCGGSEPRYWFDFENGMVVLVYVTHRAALFQHQRDELQHGAVLTQLCICACKLLCLLTTTALLSVENPSARL